jgi:hypothetical protein
MVPGGGTRLSALGNLGSSYALLASTNLSDWTAILKFTCTNIPMVLSDPASTSLGRRFYRVAPVSAVPGPKLRFPSPRSLGTNPTTLALDGVPGFSYQVDTSTNLRNWTPFTNFSSTTPTMYIQDAPATNTNRKFYRAETQ